MLVMVLLTQSQWPVVGDAEKLSHTSWLLAPSAVLSACNLKGQHELDNLRLRQGKRDHRTTDGQARQRAIQRASHPANRSGDRRNNPSHPAGGHQPGGPSRQRQPCWACSPERWGLLLAGGERHGRTTLSPRASARESQRRNKSSSQRGNQRKRWACRRRTEVPGDVVARAAATAMTTTRARWPNSTLRLCDDGILRPTCTVLQTAQHLGVSETTARRWLRPWRVRIGSRVYYKAVGVYQQSAQ